jgi:hypothetical protein
MKQTIIFLLALVVVFASCKTEVDLNAPYKSTTIIFGLLDPDSNQDNVLNHLDTQWIKINKTFLGEGDNTAYASIRDSSEYSDDDFVKKVVYELENGLIVDTFFLESKTVSNRNMNGIFYGPEQTVYFFHPDPNERLNPNSEYRIELEFTDGRVVTATTNAVNPTGLNPSSSLKLASLSSNGGYNYTAQVLISWSKDDNAGMYEASFRFHFTELVYATADHAGDPISETPKFLDFYVGRIMDVEALTSQGGYKLNFNGREFYTFLQNNLVADPKIRREIGVYNGQRTECFDIMVTMGNEDLKSYIDVNSPSTGLVQERPIYSNVSNGIGLFASRGTGWKKSLPIVTGGQNETPNQGTLTALVESEYTYLLNFCDPAIGSDFYCGN